MGEYSEIAKMFTRVYTTLVASQNASLEIFFPAMHLELLLEDLIIQL